MNHERRARLLAQLADGGFHSGEALAATAGISRTAVWKQIQTLRQRGLDIFSVQGKGYRLARPYECLDAGSIQSALPQRQYAPIKVFFELASTNQYLLEQAVQHGEVCLAEYQSAGRGRHGHGWQSPLGAGLYLSIAWRADGLPEPVTGLSLAAGLAVLRALKSCDVPCNGRHGGVGLKWPNDLLCDGRKLGGILLQVRGEVTGPCLLVLGVGINLRLPVQANTKIDQPVTDLAQIIADLPSRNHLAALLIHELSQCLERYPQQGFAGLRSDWHEHDVLRGRQVTLHLGERRIEGEMLGVDADGALLLGQQDQIQRFASGELSVRISP